jgi:hypothetical protein
MTREDIIRMAREAGLFVHKEVQPELERFAALVAAAQRERIAAEWDGHMYGDLEDIDIGSAIRARKENT